jgi:mono/diheme cytochrome c family protein
MFKAVAIAGLAMLAGSGIASSTNKKDETRARELFLDVCTACHTLDRVKAQALSKDEWAGLIKGMVSEGAAITDEEMDLIVGYLAEHYGDK